MVRPASDRREARKRLPAEQAGHRTAPTEPRARVLPEWRAVFDWRSPYLIPVILLLVSRVGLMLTIPATSEDAFITFRYARNLASGHGLVYNPGEHVLGFTSPLWTLWSAVGIKLVGQPVPWAIFWSVAADLVTLLVGGALVCAVTGTAAAWAFTLFFAAWPYFAALAVSGMEMSLCLALLFLAASLLHARQRAAGPVLAALAFARPEGMAVALVLSLVATRRDRIVAFSLTGAGVLALTLRFGSPIPTSLLAKASVYGFPGPWAGRFWWEWLSPLVLGRWPANGDPALLMSLAVITGPAAVMGARELWRQRATALAALVAALLVVWLGYAIVGVAYFWWYFVFPLTAAGLLASVGLPQVVRGPAIPIALVLFVLSIWTLAHSLYRGRSYTETGSFGVIAGALRDHCRPGDSVMLEPIGMIGYSCPVRVIDETGLVSPEVARRRLQGPGWYTDIVAAQHPEWLVVRRGVIEGQAAFAGAGRPFRDTGERDSLLAHYQLVQSAGDPTGPAALMLLRRGP